MHATLLSLALLSQPVIQRAPAVTARLVAAAPGRAPADGPVQVRLGTRVTLYAVVQVGRGWRARYFTDAPSLRLQGRRIPKQRLRALSRLPGARLRWFLVEPHQHHQRPPYPNKGDPTYANAVLLGPRHGRWIGFDKLEYHETLLPRERGGRLQVSRAVPTHKKVNVHGGLGTMHYRVEVRWQGGQASSPGAPAAVRRGLSPAVMRVSWRAADDLAGWLTSYYNVPYVFGSAGAGAQHQTERYQGTDCADVIVGAARRAGAKLAYTHVAGLLRYARAVTGKLLLTKAGLRHVGGPRKGRPARLRFGRDVRRGDLMLINYVGFYGTGRGWDHVGVVSGDRGQKGWLDPADEHLHMGYQWGLAAEPLSAQGRAVVQFLRLKPRARRAMARRRALRQRARRAYRRRRLAASPVRARK